MGNQKNKYLLAGMGLVIAASLHGCSAASSSLATGGSGGTSAAAGGVNLGGTLALASGQTLASLDLKASPLQNFASLMKNLFWMVPSASATATDFSTLNIKCTTLTDPPVTVAGTVSSTGLFSIDHVPGNAVGCLLFDGSGNQVAGLDLSDPSSKDMNGNSLVRTRAQYSKDASFGTVVLNPSTGSALVTLSAGVKSSLDDTVIPAGSLFDPTGEWAMSAYPNKPDGYASACAVDAIDCNGPKVGEKVYLRRLKGKSFTPDGTCQTAADTHGDVTGCSGTTGADDVYGIMAWTTQTAFASCGSKLGFAFDEAKAFAHVDLTGDGIAGGNFTWSTNDGSGPNSIAEGWKFAAATSTQAIRDCEMVTVTVQSQSQPAFSCHDHVNNTYQISLNGGGCKLKSTGLPFQLNDWSSSTVTWGSSTTQDLGGGFTQYTMPGTTTSGGHEIICTSTNGTFTDAAGTTPGGVFNYTNVSETVASGASCSAIASGGSSDQLKLLQLQCYAEYLWRSGGDSVLKNENLCMKDLRTNFSATTPADFVITPNGPKRAATNHLTEQLVYTGADSMTMHTTEEDYRSLQANQSMVNCHLYRKQTISLKKKDATHMVMEFNTETINASKDIPLCVAGEATLGTGVQKMMMLMTKQ